MDAEGKVLASPGERSVEGFNQTLELLQAYLDLKARSEAGDESVAVELFLTELLELRNIGFEEARARHGKLEGLSDEEDERVRAELVDLEVKDLIDRVNARQVTPDEAAATFVEMAKAGRAPTAPQQARLFWQQVLMHADRTEDPKLYEQALVDLKAMFGSDARNAAIFAQYEQRLKELKDG